MKFENVTVDVAGNSYFDGAVTSRTVHFSDGSRKTLGYMQKGEYEFGTEEAELMEITAGEVEYKLADSDEFVSVQAGGSFNVPANSKFQIKVHAITDYCCSYL